MEHTTENENWMNEHGEPDFEYLNSLAKDGEPESLEKLKSIAEDLDVEYHDTDSVETLVEKIRSATRINEAVDPMMTS